MKLKRFRSDEFESCVSFDMKYDRNNVGYIIFYKFEDAGQDRGEVEQGGDSSEAWVQANDLPGGV
jgi:hypothetical protein